jgi:hypothetical protein
VTTTHYGPRPDGPGDTLHTGAQQACNDAECTVRAVMAAREEVRALTVGQPWGFSIAEGFKPVENRPKRTLYRGTIYIHTRKHPYKDVNIVRYSRPAAVRLQELGGRGNYWDAIATIPSRFFKNSPTLALSAVIATARITGCHQEQDGCCAPWGFPDVWHWELSDVRPLKTAVPAKGALGLWKPPFEVVAAVLAQQTEASR